jgi:hypothetical protein
MLPADLFICMLSQPIDVLGYLAAVFVGLTFCCQSMLLLRSFAIVSNLCFIAYGWAAQLMPVLILHCAILPVNIGYFFREWSRRQIGLEAADRSEDLNDGTRFGNLGQETSTNSKHLRPKNDTPRQRARSGPSSGRYRAKQRLNRETEPSALAQLGKVRSVALRR